jgi:crossover junction endodeoxyribonuclease RuvC
VIAIGVDPGTAATGYGVVTAERGAQARLLECGVIRTNASHDLSSRLLVIFEGITDVIARYGVSCMAVESAFYARNVRTTLVLGHARGVILLAGRINGLEVFEYPPAEIKKAIVGTGAATKEQVQFMVAKLLRLKQAPQPSDAADGVAAALAHLQGVRLRQLVQQAAG